MPFFQFAQDYSALWKGYFSYYNIKDVIQGSSKIYAASENAVFSYDIQTNQIDEITTINGLLGETISTIHYSTDYELLMVGYENGRIEIVFDNDDDVLSIVDIIDKTTIPPNNKRINHFYAYGNNVYISTNYGISVFNLERLEFGDTYFIGNAGEQTTVKQTVVFQDYIYAACSVNGIRRALVSNSHLIDFNNWETVVSGSFHAIAASINNLYVLRSDRNMLRLVGNTLNALYRYASMPLDVNTTDENIIVTTRNNVYVYNDGFNTISQVSVNTEFNTLYTSATVLFGNLFIGTQDFGVLQTALSNPSIFEEIHPDGPLLNKPFSLQTDTTGIWVTFGEYTIWYNPYANGGPHKRGISRLKNEEWINIPYDNVLEGRSLNSIAINPLNRKQVFISSFYSGLLELDDEIPTILYNDTNTILEKTEVNDLRIGTSAFDDNGLLWISSGYNDKQLNTYNPSNNQWRSYSLDEVIPKGSNNSGFSDVIIDDNQIVWLGSINYGLIGFNPSNGKMKAIYTEDQNMPINYTGAIAVDKQNQVWIGTHRGLRVLYNTSNFFEDDDIKVSEIIIEEDGIAKELLYQQQISDIIVDGANNKWIGTADSGLFYLSSNGQNTIYHFTTNNSPIPSNTIKEIAIDENSGTVYIATSRGLVSFDSGSTGTKETLEEAFVYPNPVRPHFNMVTDRVKIKDFSERVNIKITDVEGNLVAEAQSGINKRYNGYNLEIDGGIAYWNGKNLANNIVASGVYLIMLSDLDTFETKVLKVMVIR
ncbi:MAG: ABC transporter substrate-binding protein [Aestuariibaculum sp.]